MEKRTRGKNTIMINEMFSLFWKKKISMAIIFSISISFLLIYLNDKYPIIYSTECELLLSFRGIEKQQNPDGTFFDLNQMISPSIISEVEKMLKPENVNLKFIDYRGLISTEAVIPNDVLEERKIAIEKGELFEYFPNRFILRITSKGKKLLSDDTRKGLLNYIVEAYKKEFFTIYGETPIVTISHPKKFLDTYDYIDIINLYEGEIDLFISKIDALMKDGAYYRSIKNGLSFSDIENEAKLIKRINIQRLSDLVNNRTVTKDKESLIDRYENKVKNINLEISKMVGEAEVSIDLLRELKNNFYMRGNGKNSSGESDANFILDSSIIESIQKKDYISILIKSALEAKVRAKKLEADKSFILDKINVLNRTSEEKTDILKKELMTSLVAIQQKMEELSKKANKLHAEYQFSKINNSIRIIRGPDNLTVKSIYKYFIAVVISFLLSVLFIFTIEYRKIRD